MKSITKEYPGVKALDNVNLQVERGEIHALCGENGAGKSTLMNVLSGTIPFGQYTGDIVYNGKTCQFHNIHDSEELGIVIIHQELALIPELTIAENMFLGNERKNKLGVIDWNETYKQAQAEMKRVGLKEKSSTLIKDIGTGKQQLVEIAKALSKNVKLLILDEPTSSLNEEDSKMLLDMLLQFKKEGMTSILITHKLNEVAYCADKITILRDGATIETISNPNHNIDEERIIKGMVGRELTNRFPAREHKIGKEVMLEAKNWTVYHPVYTEKCIDDKVNFKVHKGEIVGFSGLQGAGRTELAKSLFGKAYGSHISGQEFIGGKEVHLKNERDAIEHGLAYVTEDRKVDGLVLEDSIAWNTTMARMEKVANKFGVIDVPKENKVAEEYVKKMNTKTPGVQQHAGNLSGGNQQKVAVGKWMAADCDVYIFDEPTKGVDVGAKQDIFRLINDITRQGNSVIYASCENSELLSITDRIYVLFDGHVMAELETAKTGEDEIMHYSVGSTTQYA